MVATFHLHYLGHRIKYGNLEVGNTTQQLLSTTRPCCSIEFIESFLFWVILITYDIGIYNCIYIYKVSYIHFLFVIFNCNGFLCTECYSRVPNNRPPTPIVNFSIFFHPGHLYSNPNIINFQSFLVTFLSVNSHFHHSPS